MMRARLFVFNLVMVLTLVSGALAWFVSPWWTAALAVVLPLAGLGIYDLIQTRHSILRNYPVIGHMRYLLESVRPEIRQYFIEGESEELPFSQAQRAMVYSRAKQQNDQQPFGTLLDLYEPGYSWVSHSIQPAIITDFDFRIRIGGPDCRQPYQSSVLNISGTSFGALSANAIRALNRGAKLGNFAHNTGEGSISRYHREFGGDVIWQIGTGYFGCRNSDGQFDADEFRKQAADPQVKMIELKLSQGAKPGHGGVLPKAKISEEIAETRDIPRDRDCVSPAAHSAFSTPVGMMQFIARLRDLSGGKPVGIKMAVGHRHEVMAMAKAMIETGITPDFIVIDGGEGGTGAAPPELSNHVGMPLAEGLSFVHNALIGAGLRDRIRLGASGKVISGYDLCRVFALGADYAMAARGFMFAIGCIQARTCHTNECPTGVATQDPARQRAIDPERKSDRVANFHRSTLHAMGELLSATGLQHPGELRANHIHVRGEDGKVLAGDVRFPPLPPGSLLAGSTVAPYAIEWERAQAETFAAVEVA